jgi:peptidoglycan lytic transglycosylase G
MLRLLRLLAAGVAISALLLAAVGGAGYWLYRDARAPGPLAAARTLVIPPHTGVAGIAELLAKDGVIRHKLTFELAARLSGRGAALKAGEFEFPAASSAMQALDIVASGRTVKHRLTIPEGLTSAEVVALVRAAPALDGDVGPVPQNGALLPDTYVYSYGDSRMDLIERMRRGMARLVARMWKERRPGLPLAAPEDAVILASIVEKETARPEERPHVAGVFINRLKLGMPLQADPTVLFALSPADPKLDRPLTHADLAVNSPYNTYQVKGLPPGPIDNPSLSSLRAALRPEPTEDLYFVADGSGGHVFAKTLAEQNHNIAQYLHGATPNPDGAPAEAPAAAHKTVAARHRHHLAEQAARLRHCRHEPGRACRR